ncbi:acyltransferase family protein [Chitinasiproducens palmae]|uniref:Peptidoglycan/LPS O-acetylase OafA/YrhL, contains acyltransferase and SGNH-hydrolase domains n=1 Tax=Chitinasiproducens palmae TaxID=1770053 RepID=A0A1H2PPJ9_9BURK|nr:acyltransferase [Chitinasiproducens palmae]SDV48673.1 Peptidoglycan/LPS O-acetylase OafA/YrhL, contains acyltransferase and SGNH-hydrolase domains [Chitinasiproducens palmae]
MIYSVQYLRAFAAALVLLWHVKTKSAQVGGDLFSDFKFGLAGVDIFFVISGFVMAFIYARTKPGASNLLPFWGRRFVRILPLYWLLTFAALAIFLVAPEKVNSSGGTTSIWKSFLLVPGEDKFLIENGWTLSYEIYFYVLFSLAFLIPSKARGLQTVAALILAIVSVGITGTFNAPFLASPLLMEFLFGIAVYVLFTRKDYPYVRGFGLLALPLGIAGICAVPLMHAHLPGRSWLTVGLPAALIVFGVTSQEHWLRKMPSRLLEKLGDSSYSMYLLHPFLLAIAGTLFRMMHLKNQGMAVEIGYWIATIIAVLGASFFLYKYVERPIIHTLRFAIPFVKNAHRRVHPLPVEARDLSK